MENPDGTSAREVMADQEEIVVSTSCEEDPVENASNVNNEEEETPGCWKKVQSSWHTVLIVILTVALCIAVCFLFTQTSKQQSQTAELLHMEEGLLTMWKNTKQLQKENSELKELLNSIYENVTVLGYGYGELKVLINTTSLNFTLPIEKAHLGELLKRTSQEKTELQVANRELTMHLNASLEDLDLVGEKNRLLDASLNESLRVASMASAESKILRKLLNNEQQTTKELAATNQQQHSILSSNRLSFLWRLCNNDTLRCSRCLPGWAEHDSRCFSLSSQPQKWEVARRACLDFGGDLAVVSNEADQAFLTNMTFQYVQQHPQERFHSAWIGLQDTVKEGAHFWVNGMRLHSNVTYWRPQEPNNAIPSWDTDRAGQDCVTIVPPDRIETENWLNSWDDIICWGERHFLCETVALILD